MLKLDKALFRGTRVYQQLIEEGLQEGLEKGIEQRLEKGIEQGLEKGIEQGLEKGIEQGLEKGIEQGLEKGLEKGIEQGKEEATVELAKRLLAKQLPIELVAETTGLSKAKLRRLMPRRLVPKSGKR